MTKTKKLNMPPTGKALIDKLTPLFLRQWHKHISRNRPRTDQDFYIKDVAAAVFMIYQVNHCKQDAAAGWSVPTATFPISIEMRGILSGMRFMTITRLGKVMLTAKGRDFYRIIAEHALAQQKSRKARQAKKDETSLRAKVKGVLAEHDITCGTVYADTRKKTYRVKMHNLNYTPTDSVKGHIETKVKALGALRIEWQEALGQKLPGLYRAPSFIAHFPPTAAPTEDGHAL